MTKELREMRWDALDRGRRKEFVTQLFIIKNWKLMKSLSIGTGYVIKYNH